MEPKAPSRVAWALFGFTVQTSPFFEGSSGPSAAKADVGMSSTVMQRHRRMASHVFVRFILFTFLIHFFMTPWIVLRRCVYLDISTPMLNKFYHKTSNFSRATILYYAFWGT